jgi:hypothetical protein
MEPAWLGMVVPRPERGCPALLRSGHLGDGLAQLLPVAYPEAPAGRLGEGVTRGPAPMRAPLDRAQRVVGAGHLDRERVVRPPRDRLGQVGRGLASRWDPVAGGPPAPRPITCKVARSTATPFQVAMIPAGCCRIPAQVARQHSRALVPRNSSGVGIGDGSTGRSGGIGAGSIQRLAAGHSGPKNTAYCNDGIGHRPRVDPRHAADLRFVSLMTGKGWWRRWFGVWTGVGRRERC